MQNVYHAHARKTFTGRPPQAENYYGTNGNVRSVCGSLLSYTDTTHQKQQT